MDVELDEELELPLENAMGKTRAEAPATRKPARPAQSAAAGKSKGARSRAAQSAAREETRGAERSVSNSFLSIDPAQLRHLVIDQPDLLEPGLAVYVDDSGVEVGAQYETEAGEIDLLARDEDGDLVVVMVLDAESARDAVSEMLQRIGWVRKHLAGSDAGVRGIVLLQQLSEEMGYAASAVANTIDFKTWRLSLAFEAIEI